MSILNRLPEFTVKIGTGSGCLFQPKSSDYAYILTAKHVLENGKSLFIERHLLNSKQEIEVQNLEIIGNPYQHNDPNKDAVIIKVESVNGLGDLIGIKDPFQLFSECYLVGYPNSRDELTSSFRENKINKILRVKNYGYIEAELEKFAGHSEIVGQSGGGIIGINNNKYFLIGIQKQMSAEDEKESLGRIDLMPLSFFGEIVDQYPEELSELPLINKETKTPIASETTNAIVHNALISQNSLLSSELSKEKSEKLEELRELFRTGSMKEALQQVEELRKSSNWNSFDASLQASIVRALATMILGIKGVDGISEARNYAGEAIRIETNDGDDTTLAARMAVYEKGYLAALDKLANTKTIDGFNLKLNCLLNLGKVEDLLNLYSDPPKDFIYNAESYRIFALTFLFNGNIEQAKETINKAISISPNWFYIRYNAAIINYFSAVSPIALPLGITHYPYPFNFSLIKSDEISIQSLLTASEEFKDLIEKIELNPADRRIISVWLMACLANLKGKQSDAINLSKSLISEDPGFVPALQWILYRQYDVDLSETVKNFQQKLHTGSEPENSLTIDEVLVLIGIYMRQENFNEAFDLIERTQNIFNQQNERDLWKYWRGQLLTALGDSKKALDDAKEIEGEDLRNTATTNALADISRKTGDWQPLFDYLEKRYTENDDIDSLIFLCQIKFDLGEWDYVADKAEEYVDNIKTASAARFAIASVWNAKRPNKCLSLLEKYQSLFPNNKLPGDLNRLKIQCLIDKNIVLALQEAENLISGDSDIENLMLLMLVQQVKGEFEALSVSARKLFKNTNASAVQLLQGADLIQHQNPELAKKLWSKAMEQGVLDDPILTVFAIDLSSRLGLENERTPLMQRMMEYAEQGIGPLEVMNLEQAVKIMKEGRERDEAINRSYGTANLPIHLAVQQKNISLAQIFHSIPEENIVVNIHKRPRVFIRHGGRILFQDDYSEFSKTWRLYCDITSLILAHEFGILEKVEEIFKPLRISKNVIPALIDQLKKLKPHQKSQLDESQEVLNLVSKEKLKVIDSSIYVSFDKIEDFIKEQSETSENTEAQSTISNQKSDAPVFNLSLDKFEEQLGFDRLQIITAALNENGFAVGFTPLTCYGVDFHALLKLPEPLKQFIVNSRTIADSLRSQARISEKVFDESTEALGQEGLSTTSVIPLVGTKLFLMNGIADVLSKAGLLSSTCSSFEVAISESFFNEAKLTVQYYERLAKTERWLNKLISQISEGLDNGTYEFISINDEQQAQKAEDDDRKNKDFISTLDLLLFEPQENDIIWADDRVLNKFPVRKENQYIVPVIAISEILLVLKQRDEIDDQKYYEILMKLRERNFRYLPFDKNEIIYHLKLAQIRNGRIVETEALSILRRYYASCLLDKDLLQLADVIDGTPNPHSEISFLTENINTIFNTIATIWADERSSIEVASARSNWIIDNLYTGVHGCSHLRNSEIVENNSDIDVLAVTSDIVNFLIRGLSINENSLNIIDTNQRRNHYFNWLTDRVINTRYAKSPKILKNVALEIQNRFEQILKNNFEPPGTNFPTTQLEFFKRAYLGKFFVDLPEVIAQNFAPEIVQLLEVKIGSTITTNNINFEFEEYWKSVEITLEKGSSTIESEDLKQFNLVKEQSNDSGNNIFPVIKIETLDGEQIGEINDSSLGILNPNVNDRRLLLKKLRQWFDVNDDNFEVIANDLINIVEPLERVKSFLEWRDNSTEFFYLNLEQKFRTNNYFITWEELLPPSANNLLGRFRLPTTVSNSNDFAKIWKGAVIELLKEDDLIPIIARCSSLPITMAEEVIENVSHLSVKEKRKLFDRLSKAWCTPIRQMHLVNLILRSASNDEVCLDIARQVLVKIYSEEGEKDFQAFLIILKFFEKEFEEWEDTKSWAAEIKLAMIWVHSCRIHNLLFVIGIRSESIIDFFERKNRDYFQEFLVRNSDTWYDLTHPRNLTRVQLLTHGFANLVQDVSQDILDLIELPKLIKEQMFQNLESVERFPATPLLRDPSLYQNKLETILGGDRFTVFSSIIASEYVEVLSSEGLKKGIEHLLLELSESPSKIQNWIWINFVAGDLPIYAELAVLCNNALKKFNPVPISDVGFFELSSSFRGASHQAVYLRDDSLRQKFREYIFDILRHEIEEANNGATKIEPTSLEEKIAHLIDIALIISFIPDNAVKSIKNFTSIIEDLFDYDQSFPPLSKRIFFAEVWSTPVNESKDWWHLALKLRTLKTNE